MLDQPSKELATFDFDPSVRVLCLSQASTIKSLQWVLDRRSVSGPKFQLFPAQLHELAQGRVEADLILLTLELGQPVPLENLKQITGVSGLCALEQPTPAQLLQLLELGNFEALSWDGSSFEKIADRLESLMLKHQEDFKEREFLKSCRSWIVHHQAEPAEVLWLNPPDSYKGVKTFTMDKHRGSLSFGCAQSHADVKIPLPGIEELCVLHYKNQKWEAKNASRSLEVHWQTQEDERLHVGDLFEVGEFQFQFKANSRVEELSQLAKRLGFLKDKGTFRSRGGVDGTLSDLCKELLFSGLTGELRVASDMKNGAIYFEEGLIVQAVSGAVTGTKALLRMLSWERPSWKFAVDRVSPSLHQRISVGLSEFPRIHQGWLKKWHEIGPYVPPAQLRLQADREKFLGRTEWTARECQVMAAVCEYGLVRDVLNNCLLQDIDIFETLVSLRKQGLLEIQSN